MIDSESRLSGSRHRLADRAEITLQLYIQIFIWRARLLLLYGLKLAEFMAAYPLTIF